MFYFFNLIDIKSESEVHNTPLQMYDFVDMSNIGDSQQNLHVIFTVELYPFCPCNREMNSFRVFEEIFFRFTSTNLYLLVSNLNVFDIETRDNGQMNKNFK